MSYIYVYLGHPRENGFGEPSWLGSTEVEYKACTEGVAVVDLTSLGLFEIEVRRTVLCIIILSMFYSLGQC